MWKLFLGKSEVFSENRSEGFKLQLKDTKIYLKKVERSDQVSVEIFSNVKKNSRQWNNNDGL